MQKLTVIFIFLSIISLQALAVGVPTKIELSVNNDILESGQTVNVVAECKDGSRAGVGQFGLLAQITGFPNQRNPAAEKGQDKIFPGFPETKWEPVKARITFLGEGERSIPSKILSKTFTSNARSSTEKGWTYDKALLRIATLLPNGEGIANYELALRDEKSELSGALVELLKNGSDSHY
ncbi:MAG: hypothetical protein JWQ35_286 [Bacteriovoracaceae bacterium]|nr:hypothetical protein [Bacteriovoracaceae bacterium]